MKNITIVLLLSFSLINIAYSNSCDSSRFVSNVVMSPGDDLKKESVSSAQDCCAACVNEGDSCTCWTFITNESSHNCFLHKGDPDTQHSKDNRISGKCGSNPPPPPPNHGTLDFLVMGDWGGNDESPYTTSGERAICASMGKWISAHGQHFVLGLGDNFYYNGIPTDEHDSRFKTTFEDCFSDDSMKDTQFHFIAGNHDHLGNVQAEVDYSKLSSRWNFPNLFYSMTQSVGSKTVQFIMIDTKVLAGNVDDQEDPSAQPLGPDDIEESSSQLDWIKDEMRKSTADYIFVAGHYPVYSACEHGPTGYLVDNIKPLLEQYGAHYMNGHEHCQELIEYHDINYFTIGDGHSCCYKNTNQEKIPSGSLKYIRDDENKGDIKSGFAHFHMTEDYFYVEYIDNSGNVKYTTNHISPRSQTKFMTY